MDGWVAGLLDGCVAGWLDMVGYGGIWLRMVGIVG